MVAVLLILPQAGLRDLLKPFDAFVMVGRRQYSILAARCENHMTGYLNG